ncbi:MAG TPA: D-alanyl-D-alanine carboxypeptidase family protein [Patescibacteria group bacterium]|nr:D-alanyl-D-alanine carboxypeptidase family protein [Patescibacteria group bacterium]
MLLNLAHQLLALFLLVHALLYGKQATPLLVRAQSLQIPPDITLSVKNPTFAQFPDLSATSYILLDVNSGEILAQKDIDKQLFPASTTKMLTAIVASEFFDPNHIVTVVSHDFSDTRTMKLVPGEQIRVRDLLSGLLIHSANDAAFALADSYPGGIDAFMSDVNKKAVQLGMSQTHFTNPAGLEDSQHVTTVRDLGILAREVMKDETLKNIVNQRGKTVRSSDGRFVHQLMTTNELLGVYPGMVGIKTGWTDEAGECFVSEAVRGNQTLLTVVLNSTDRFGETRKLLDWGFNNFTSETKTLVDWTTN